MPESIIIGIEKVKGMYAFSNASHQFGQSKRLADHSQL